MVTLVDLPLIAATTVRAVREAFLAHPEAPLVRPRRGDRYGHPVIFKKDVFDPLRRADPAVGAKAVLRAYAVEDVDVDDPGVIRDVDTRDDYRRLIDDGGRP